MRVQPEAVPRAAAKAVPAAISLLIVLLFPCPVAADEVDDVLEVEAVTATDEAAEAMFVEVLQAKELELREVREKVRQLEDTIRRLEETSRRLARTRSEPAARVEPVETFPMDRTPRRTVPHRTPSEEYARVEKGYLEVLERDPNNADAHYNLGILYEDYLDKPELAEHHYREFLRVAPDGPDAAQVYEWLISLP